MRTSFFGLILLLTVTIAMSLVLHVILMRPARLGWPVQAAATQGHAVEPALAVSQTPGK